MVMFKAYKSGQTIAEFNLLYVINPNYMIKRTNCQRGLCLNQSTKIQNCLSCWVNGKKHSECQFETWMGINMLSHFVYGTRYMDKLNVSGMLISVITWMGINMLSHFVYGTSIWRS